MQTGRRHRIFVSSFRHSYEYIYKDPDIPCICEEECRNIDETKIAETASYQSQRKRVQLSSSTDNRSRGLHPLLLENFPEHVLPLGHRLLFHLKRLVVFFASRFVTRIRVLLEIRVRQSLFGCYPLLRI